MVFKGSYSSLRFLGLYNSTWEIAKAQRWQQQLWHKQMPWKGIILKITSPVDLLGEAYGDLEAKGHGLLEMQGLKN